MKQYFQIVDMGYITLTDLSTNCIRHKPFETQNDSTVFFNHSFLHSDKKFLKKFIKIPRQTLVDKYRGAKKYSNYSKDNVLKTRFSLKTL